MHLPNVSVTCPWCGTYYPARPTTTNCMNCGGILPAGISNKLGEKPPLPPRELPKKYIRKVLLWKNTKAFIGFVFLCVGIPTIPLFGFGLIFTILGYFFYKSGRKEGMEIITALQNGIATEGTILSVSYVTTESINGKHPFLVKYTFNTKDGKEQIDSVKCWNEQNELRTNGDKVWIVYTPDNPENSSPWPPLE